jgi:hypothetical protein
MEETTMMIKNYISRTTHTMFGGGIYFFSVLTRLKKKDATTLLTKAGIYIFVQGFFNEPQQPL